MAPIKDEAADALRDLVSKLESRVEQLEAKLEQSTGGPRRAKPPSSGIRMILMGPPGAGMI
jgi:adenylate kinase